ncbi:MAG: hypothetical protein R3D00_23685 [Bacteroidia bacterium]
MKNLHLYLVRLGMICLIAALIILPGCEMFRETINEIEVTREETLAEIEHAISTIENNSSAWQSTLENLEKELTSDLQETVKFEVTQLINSSIGALSSNVVCIMDAIPTRAIRTLEDIKIRFLGGEASVVIPTLCQSNMNSIDLNQNPVTRAVIQYNGYDMDSRYWGLYQVFLMKGNDSLDISAKQKFQTEYQFTIDISNMETTLASYDFLQIRFNGTVLGGLSIIQKQNTPPVTSTITVTPSLFGGFIPPHTNGDREYAGHGPKTKVYGYVGHNDRQAWVYFYMHAQETKSDWTTASGYSSHHVFYTAPVGKKILNVSGASTGKLFEYTDSNIFDDVISSSWGTFTMVGDSEGDDAGIDTGIKKVTFTQKFAIDIVSQ